LLVDADLRNPTLHKTLGLDNRNGLSNLLTGAGTLESVVQHGVAPNLSVVTCGPLPPNPAELLASQRLRTLMDDAQAAFDIVILDGPPVMGLADGPMIASAVAGVLLVVEASKTGKVQAAQALRRLLMGRGRVLGAALTKFDSRSASYGYGYAYEYEYDYGKNRSKSTRALDSLASRARRLVGSK
jgi:capsular exopolysaccharide synthesis family protein